MCFSTGVAQGDGSLVLFRQHSYERDVVFRAYVVPVVPVDEDIVPEHERVQMRPGSRDARKL